MAKIITPLDTDTATLDIDADIARFLGKGSARSLKIQKFGSYPGKKSRKIAFNIVLKKEGADDLQKSPIVLRISSRDARQLARAFADAADVADGIA